MDDIPIIYLNGVTSAGKTTLAKGLQREIEAVALHVGIDAFIEMLPEAVQNDRQLHAENFSKFERGFHASIAALVAQSNNVVVDHVMSPEGLDAAIGIFSGLDVLFVGVHCSLEELERREVERGDRRIGQAREQLEKIHKNAIYDIELDTSALSRELCVQQIVDYVRCGRKPTAFDRMRQQRDASNRGAQSGSI